MNDLALSEDQRDALQEIANIGMGQAGARLAVLLGRFVHLSVPRIIVVDTESLQTAVRDTLKLTGPVTALRQGFRCDVSGEAITLFDSVGATRLYDTLFPDSPEVAAQGADTGELFSEVANLITGACLAGLFEQIGQSPTFSAPRLIGEQIDIEEVLHPSKLPWDRALMLEVNLHTEDGDFGAHLLSLMTLDAVRKLGAALEAFLSSL
jgi:chemotaxis protein CheC